MAKQSRGAIPASEHGVSKGTYHGTRNNDTMPEKGGQNATTNQSMRGAGGVAPKPFGGAALPGNDRPSHPVTNSMARVKNTGSAASGGIPNPVRKPNSNLRNTAVGQPNPNTAAASTAKPARHRANKLLFGEY